MNGIDRCYSIDDMRRRARRRMPHVAWEYLDSGTGPEQGVARNIRAMEAVTLTPRFFIDATAPDLGTRFLGQDFAAPFGVAPVGLQSLMWPGAEVMLARAAGKAGVPYCLSTVAGETLEAVAKAAGERFWFQLYAPVDADIRRDLLRRAAEAGARALVVTVDVPLSSRRERQKRAGVGMPPRMTPGFVADLLLHPAWLAATLSRGTPRFRVIERYASKGEATDIAGFIGRRFSLAVTPEILAEIRSEWAGPLLVKGVMHPDDVEISLQAGADGIWVSNHGARQLDPVPSAVEVLPGLVEAVAGRAPIAFDSGVRNGGDIARAVALGAEMVFLGRPFVWAVGAHGRHGATHAMTLLREELANVMGQVGARSAAELRERLT